MYFLVWMNDLNRKFEIMKKGSLNGCIFKNHNNPIVCKFTQNLVFKKVG